MSRLFTKLDKPRATLPVVLRRVHLKVVLISVILIGMCSIAIELVLLRMYTINNLELVARTLSYTVEAGLVFGDREATTNILAEIAANHSVADAQVIDGHGNNFASWQRFNDGLEVHAAQALAVLILPQPVIANIYHDGKIIGEVRLIGYGRDILRLLIYSTGAAFLSFVLSSIAAYYFSRKLGQEMVGPIHEMTRIAHDARRKRQFSSRVTATNIEELYKLGDDFNTLLSDLELWHAQMNLEKETLKYQTDHDPLTDLFNRAYFENFLKQAIQDANDSAYMLAVFFIDSDNFKTINETYGHNVGDEVLRTIGFRLKAHVRADDIVSRLGGDEFAILIDHLNDVDLAKRIAENILASMNEPISLKDGNIIKSSLSIGIAVFPTHADDAEALLKVADDAMYLAKRSQGDAFQIATIDDIL